MSEKAVQASSRRVVDIRVTDNAGEVAWDPDPDPGSDSESVGPRGNEPSLGDAVGETSGNSSPLCRSIYRSGRDIAHRRVHALYWLLCEAFHRPVIRKAPLLQIIG